MDSIIEAKQAQLDKRLERVSLSALRAVASMQSRPVPFLTHVDNHVALIGHIRYQMPLTGDLSTRYDPVMQARQFVGAGVDAVSLFTDTVIERDGTTDMTLVSDALRQFETPVISQDYVLHEYHVIEARAAGASVVVLTSGMVPASKLRALTSIVHRNRMTAVVAVYNMEQLHTALTWSPQVIGLGGRSPLDSRPDWDLIRRLRRHVPPGQRVILCTPVQTPDDLHAALDVGFDAITIGRQFLTHHAPPDNLDALRQR